MGGSGRVHRGRLRHGGSHQRVREVRQGSSEDRVQAALDLPSHHRVHPVHPPARRGLSHLLLQSVQLPGPHHDRHHHHDGRGHHPVLHQQDGPQDLLLQDGRLLASLLLQHHYHHHGSPHRHGLPDHPRFSYW